jgi:hypothetical protein
MQEDGTYAYIFKSSDQKTSKLFVQDGIFHGRTCGYKWSLLKFREEKYKGSRMGPR